MNTLATFFASIIAFFSGLLGHTPAVTNVQHEPVSINGTAQASTSVSSQGEVKNSATNTLQVSSIENIALLIPLTSSTTSKSLQVTWGSPTKLNNLNLFIDAIDADGFVKIGRTEYFKVGAIKGDNFDTCDLIIAVAAISDGPDDMWSKYYVIRRKNIFSVLKAPSWYSPTEDVFNSSKVSFNHTSLLINRPLPDKIVSGNLVLNLTNESTPLRYYTSRCAH